MTAPIAPPPAGLARRFAALVYELLLATAIVLITGFAALPLVSPGASGALEVPGLAQRVVLFCLVFTALAAYFTWSWSRGRRTLPMKTWRLALVLADGRAVPVRAALARYLAAWIGPALAVGIYAALRPAGLGAHAAWLVAFNFLWAFVDPARAFLHDRIAGTRIVRV
ncbi:MAG: RDD family protein [Betaproteobacteria bacterium]|nr:RDD family protein [Betaproteobacteria bacterium]MCC7215951.1 RDD family protein [Burkholderiales bacterium]